MKTKLFLVMAFLSFSLLNAQEVGDTFIIGELTYEITALGSPNEVKISDDGASTGEVNITSPVTDANMIDYNVTAIGNSAFISNTNITSLVLPTSVTLIGDSAFSGCSSLASANLENLVEVQRRGFRDCSNLEPTNTTFSNLTTTGLSPFDNCDSFTTISVPALTNADNYTFVRCSSLTSVTLSSALVTIPVGMFLDSSVTSVTIPGNAVTTIETSAFQNCSSLQSFTIPDGVTSIGNIAFRNSGVTSITVPTGVTAIEDGTFRDCSSLASITLPSGVASIGNTVFSGCTSLTTIELFNPTPPTITSTTFGSIDISAITLAVPAGAQATYDAADTWTDFQEAILLSNDNVAQDLDFNIYNNSVNGVIVISGENTNNAIVSIYDISGKQLSTYKTVGTSSEISVSNLASGVYILKIKTETAEFTKKFVKQ